MYWFPAVLYNKVATMYCCLAFLYNKVATIYCFPAFLYNKVATLYCFPAFLYNKVATMYCFPAFLYNKVATMYCFPAFLYNKVATMYCFSAFLYNKVATMYRFDANLCKCIHSNSWYCTYDIKVDSVRGFLCDLGPICVPGVAEWVSVVPGFETLKPRVPGPAPERGLILGLLLLFEQAVDTRGVLSVTRTNKRRYTNYN